MKTEEQRWHEHQREREIWRSIGGRIRRLRKARGLTIEQLAAGAHVVPQQVVRVEAGTSGTTMSRLFDVAEALNVPIVALIDQETGGDRDLTYVKGG